ncbi:MAG TPA: hypothetical protein VFF26_04430 [Gallionella sp.]|nr:hypothetical protein [Gallionella sp.]
MKTVFPPPHDLSCNSRPDKHAHPIYRDRRQLDIDGGHMVDETLKRLLDAEAKSEQIVARADEERQSIVEQARRDAGAAEQQHAARMAEIHADFLAQAEQRAQQTIAELQRRHAEQALALRAAAQRNEPQALAEAVALITGSNRP